MNRLLHSRLFVLIFLLASLTRSQAVENLATGTYNTSPPTNSNIPNWTTGWPASGITGWNHVGVVGQAGGVYLGRGWILTAGHVGTGTFTIGGFSYPVVPNTTHGSDIFGTADLVLFQIASPPSLPPLTIATSAPKALSPLNSGSSVAMLGFGGGAESWGLNTVTQVNVSVQVSTYTTTDFETAYGTTTAGTHSATNNYAVVVGDSGGGDFIFNSSTSKWELAGLNEAIDQSNNSYFIQTNNFASQINSITSAPAPPGVTTAAATNITQTGATLNGSVNAQNLSTTVSFDYGAGTGYGTNVAGTPATATGANPTTTSVTLTGLAPGTTYHFRVDGTNSAGVSTGGDLSFTTLPSALQSWRQTYFGTTSNNGDAADTADPHFTGIPNLAVFAFFGPNQNPAQAMIRQLPQPQQSGGNLFYSFTQPSGVSGITYGAQWSATLQPNTWQSISDTGSGSQHLFSVPVGSNSKLFIRLTVTDPQN